MEHSTDKGQDLQKMERRGAAQVVAIDIEDHLLWDWPPDYRATDLAGDPGFTTSISLGPGR
jgi:hypothetical protein